MTQRQNGGMLYIQIAFAFIFGVAALVVGITVPPPHGGQPLVVGLGLALILVGMGGAVYAYVRRRRR